MYDFLSVTSHALGPLPLSQTVTPSRTPSPLERDVLYGRPFILWGCVCANLGLIVDNRKAATSCIIGLQPNNSHAAILAIKLSPPYNYYNPVIVKYTFKMELVGLPISSVEYLLYHYTWKRADLNSRFSDFKQFLFLYTRVSLNNERWRSPQATLTTGSTRGKNKLCRTFLDLVNV